MLSSIAIAEDERGHELRSCAHGLDHWSGNGNIDAILEARDDFYSLPEVHLPARRADDDDDDGGNDNDKDKDKDKNKDQDQDQDNDESKDSNDPKHNDTKNNQNDKDNSQKDDKDDHQNEKDKEDKDKDQSHQKDQTTDSHPTQTDTADQKKPTETADPKTTDEPKTTKAKDTKTTEAPKTTNTKSASATKTSSKVRVTVSTISQSDVVTLTLPTLYPGGITGLPSPQVPSTADAPYRQSSKYPEGFIFILVGSIIGFAFLCVLAWRGLVAWSINRSVRRTAVSSAKSTTINSGSGSGEYETDPMVAPFGKVKSRRGQGADLRIKKTRRRRSAGSSGLLGSAYTDVPMKSPMVETRPSRSESPFSAAAAPSPGYQRNGSALFYSPTANPTMPIQGPGQSQRRNKSGTYLPAGYYPTSPSHSNSRSRQPPSPGILPHSRQGSGSQFLPTPQHLPLSAQHLQRLNTMSQDPHQPPPQSFSRQPSASDNGRHPPVSYLQSYSSTSLAPHIPPRPPSSMLDELLGSGASADGSAYSGHNNDNDGDRSGRGSRNGRR